jgi:hypothetical protein
LFFALDGRRVEIAGVLVWGQPLIVMTDLEQLAVES